MRHFFKVSVKIAMAGALTFLLLELALGWVNRGGKLPLSIPTYSLANARSRFWADQDPIVGVWHEPHSSYRHRMSAFDITYTANAHGARDRERSFSAEGAPRVVVMGDSFVEGYGVETADRLSDRLERSSGVAHLNFGTSGSFGPTQYFLLYTSRVARFEHDAVMVGLLPDNDFHDDDPAFLRAAHASRYRPFLEGRYPEYDLAYTRSALPALAKGASMERLALQFSNTAILLKHIIGARRQQASGRPENYSGYFDFTPEQFDRMRFVIEQFHQAVGSRRLLVFTIPCWNDLERVRTSGPAPLPAKLAAVCKELGVEYVDILPAELALPDRGASCYLPCDRHWSARGNEVAAGEIEKTAFYKALRAAGQ